MRFPDFLKKNGTIGFPAPSFGCSTEPYLTSFKNAQKVFQELGHKVICGPNAYAGEGIGISNSPQKCGEEWNQMYQSEDCDVLISCGGGELMCEILDYVDFEAVRKAKPKWFMGYSDNTNLSFLLATLCDTASVYGPCAPTFGMEPWHDAVRDAYQLLTGGKLQMEGYPFYETESLKDEDHPLEPYNCTEPRMIRLFQGNNEVTDAFSAEEEIVFRGRLIGGCLDCLVNLAGTCFDKAREFGEKYSEDGVIWFLEACDLNVFAIRRAVWELQHAGWFTNVKGFLIGRPLAGQEEMMGLDHIHAVTDLLGEYQVPVLLDVDLGHLPPMMPVIVGSMAEVRVRPGQQKMRLSMELR